MEKLQYTSELIRKMQVVELDMLKEFDRICRKYEITYILDAGTLLGAVRNGGFIPWDDDVDIRMLRHEYDRFCEVCRTELDENKYFLQNHDTDKGFLWGYARILRVGTVFMREGQDMLTMKRGIFIDIFPCDVLPDSIVLKWKYTFNCFIARKMLYSEVALSKKICIIYKFFYAILNMFSKETAYKIFKKQAQKYNGLHLQRVRCQGWGDKVETIGFLRKWFDETSEIIFEGYSFKCPKDYHGFLVHSFGEDYMTPPPENDRKPRHTATFIKFPE